MALGENFSRPPPASDGSRCSLACSHITPISVPVFTWPFPSGLYVPNLPLHFSYKYLLLAHPGNPGLSRLEILKLITSAKTLFPNTVTLTDSDRILTYLFLGGPHSTCWLCNVNMQVSHMYVCSSLGHSCIYTQVLPMCKYHIYTIDLIQVIYVLVLLKKFTYIKFLLQVIKSSVICRNLKTRWLH